MSSFKHCTTEGCERKAVGRFEAGGVGSDHCQPCLNALGRAEYDRQALTGAAEFFEQMATMGNPAPLAFAQAIRRALPARGLTDE